MGQDIDLVAHQPLVVLPWQTRRLSKDEGTACRARVENSGKSARARKRTDGRIEAAVAEGADNAAAAQRRFPKLRKRQQPLGGVKGHLLRGGVDKSREATSEGSGGNEKADARRTCKMQPSSLRAMRMRRPSAD